MLLLMFTTAMSLTSCSTRKVDLNISKVNTEVKNDSSSVENKVTIKETENKKDIDNWIETIVPVDTSKAIVITDSFGKKTYFKNAKIKREKIIDKSEIKEKISIIESHDVQKKSTENKTDFKKEKQVEKTYSWTNILWLLIPVALYFGYKKYKQYIWFV